MKVPLRILNVSNSGELRDSVITTRDEITSLINTITSYTLITKQSNISMNKQLELFTMIGDQLELDLDE